MRYPPLLGDVSKWAERLIRQLNRDYEEWGGLRWEKILVPAKSLSTEGSAGGQPDRDTDNEDLLFDDSSTEQIPVTVIMPNGFKLGRSVVPVILYEPTTSLSGVVVWTMTLNWRNVGDSFNYSTSFDVATQTVTLSAGMNRLHRATFATLSTCVTSILSLIEMRVARLGGSAADTYVGDIRLKAVGVECQTDARGSRTQTIKD